jgi:hypothetical protein
MAGKCIYAYTAPGALYPPYLNLAEDGDGGLGITDAHTREESAPWIGDLPHAATRDGLPGPTLGVGGVRVTLPRAQMERLVGAVEGWASGAG